MKNYLRNLFNAIIGNGPTEAYKSGFSNGHHDGDKLGYKRGKSEILRTYRHLGALQLSNLFQEGSDVALKDNVKWVLYETDKHEVKLYASPKHYDKDNYMKQKELTDAVDWTKEYILRK